MRAAVFVDRDGVINDPVLDAHDGRPESPLRAADVVLCAGAAEGLRNLHAAGFVLVGVSNQPAAAKGKATLADLATVHERVVALLAAHGVTLDDWRYCHHHPDATDPELRGPCDCRKPAPGMLLDAASALDIAVERSWMVGDSDADVLAGTAAGCRTVLVTHEQSSHRRGGDVTPDLIAGDLREAASMILRESPGGPRADD